MRFRNVEVVSCGSGCAFDRSRARLCRQGGYLLLVLLNRLPQLGHAFLQGQGFAGQLPGFRARLAQRFGQGLVDLVIGQPLCFARVLELFRGYGQRGHRLGRLPRSLVHDSVGAGVPIPPSCLPVQEGQVLHDSPGHDGSYQTQEHDGERYRRSYLVSTIHLFPANPCCQLLRSVLPGRLRWF